MMDIWPVFAFSDLTIKGGITWLNSWFPLSIAAVFVSLVIHTAFLMIAKAFSIKEFENYATSEMLQAVAGAVMIGSLIVMINSTLDITHSFIAGDLVCHGKSVHIGTTNQSTMDEALDAIRCRLQEKASAVASIQSTINTEAETINYFNIMNLQASILGITFLKGDWIGDVYKSTETKRITNNLATVILIGLNAQSAVILYIKSNALTMFIPFGILLRSFYFTRGAGALFLAMGVGMYFIFPLFYVLLDPNFIPAPPMESDQAQADIPQPYCYATMSSTVSVIQTLQAGGMGTTRILAQESIRDELSKAYIELMLHPLVAFFLTMVFVRYMMTVLGSDAFEVVRMVSKVV
ncbi:MAG: hypothetical protein V1861_07120 [Candidatus Micrarchaeota archaeon]